MFVYTHMKCDQHWVVSDPRVGEQQNKAHRAPNAQDDEDDRNESELHISHGRESLRLRPVGQDGPVLRQGRMLSQSSESEHGA